MTLDLSLPWQVICGDNAEYLDALPRDAALVSDPPYGMAWNTDSSRFTGGRQGPAPRGRSRWSDIHGDDRPFDPTPWLAFDKVILWGANHYAQRLPVGTTLVWVKRNDHSFGTFLSDAEIGWVRGGYGVYCWREVFMAPRRMVENDGASAGHPTQKPVGLMRRCIERLTLAPDTLIVDPYCGSGTTGVAAVQMGYRFLGIEREPAYCAIARRRIGDAAAQGRLAL